MKFAPRALMTLKALLLAVPMVALVYSNSVLLPFVFPKVIFFGFLSEIALAVFFIYLTIASAATLKELLERVRNIFKNPAFIFLSLFLLSYIISSIFADNSYRAFWGDIGRGEGVFGMLHYYSYLFLLLLVFKKEDWIRYAGIFLGTGVVLIIHSGMEYLGIATEAQTRVASLVGNPAFLATHMLFVGIFSGILIALNLVESKYGGNGTRISILPEKKGLFYAALLVGVFSLLTIFLTGTRGALLGAGMSIAFIILFFVFYKKQIYVSVYPIKRIAQILLIAFIIFAGIFAITHNADFWSHIPGLNRLANTQFFSLSDSTTQFRLLTWQVSWEAFKERPLLGWGPENFINAYEKYYNPDYSLYGDTWLDRAHNKLFDVLVMQGIIGLVLYLGFFVFLAKAIFNKIYQKNFVLSLVLFAGTVAYFVQNLFLFDQILSNVAFFSFVAFIISCTISDQRRILEKQEFGASNAKLGRVVLACAVTGGVFISLYYVFVIPYTQSKLFNLSPRGNSLERTEEMLRGALRPYNYAQASIRGLGIDGLYRDNYFYNQQLLANPNFDNITRLLVDAVHEVIEKEPYDVRFHIREAIMLAEIARTYAEGDVKAIVLNNDIEKLMREALVHAPNRQDLYYHLAFSLAGQNKFEEAVSATEFAVSLSPMVPRAHLNNAIIYAIAGKTQESKEALRWIEELNPPYQNFFPSDFNSLLLLYRTFGEKEKVFNLIRESLKGVAPRVFSRNDYFEALSHYRDIEDKENFLLVAQYLLQFDEIGEDIRILIDLAEKGEWGILKNL